MGDNLFSFIMLYIKCKFNIFNYIVFRYQCMSITIFSDNQL